MSAPGATGTGRMLEIAAAALTATALLLATEVLGALASLLALLVPLPVAWVVMRSGLLSGVATLLLTTLVVQTLGGTEAPLAYLTQFALPSLLLPWLLRRCWRWDRAAASTVIATLLTGYVALLGVATMRDQPVQQLVDGAIVTQLQQAGKWLGSSELPPDRQHELEQLLAGAEKIFKRFYPGIIAVGSSMLALLTVLCLSGLPGMRGQIAGPRLADWRAPEPLIWPLIAAGFLHFFAPGVMGWIGSNLLAFLLLIYYLQGLAVVTHLFERRRLAPLLQGAGYVLMLFASPLPLIVAGIGLFDLWIDFRKQPNREEN